MSRRIIIVSVLLALVLTALLPWHPRPDLVIYAAAVTAGPIDELRQQFEAQTGRRVSVIYDGSGALLGRLRSNVGQADLFIPAERSCVDEALAENLVHSTMPLAAMAPVIAVGTGNPKAIADFDDMLKPGVRMSLADPQAAAMGRTVKREFERRGLWPRFEERIRGGQITLRGTVSLAAADVQIGAADVSIVWDVTAKRFGLVQIHEPGLNKQMEQVTLAIVTKGQGPANEFAEFVRQRRDVFTKHGFREID